MATRIYGLSVGEEQVYVTEGVGSAVAADTVELTIDLAAIASAGASKHDVLRILERIEEHIIAQDWPPA